MKLNVKPVYAGARPELSPVCVHKENSGARPDVNPGTHTDPIRMRDDRDRNRQLPMLIVNIETVAQTE